MQGVSSVQILTLKQPSRSFTSVGKLLPADSAAMANVAARRVISSGATMKTRVFLDSDACRGDDMSLVWASLRSFVLWVLVCIVYIDWSHKQTVVEQSITAIFV